MGFGTTKGAKIDVNNVRKVPLNEPRLSETFSANVIPLIEKEIRLLLKKRLITGIILHCFTCIQYFYKKRKTTRIS